MTHRMLHVAGATLSMTDNGKGAPALLFLHYWGGSSRTWQSVISKLEKKTRCVAIDQRGWGSSIVVDGRYDLYAMADDVQAVVDRLGLGHYVLVGHSMGGKVAQIVAARRVAGLVGLVLVAPAPPTPMPVPVEQRSTMLRSYETREGVIEALSILAGSPLSDTLREQVIADTLRGTRDGKRAWTESGMILDVSAGLAGVTVPVSIVVGDRDQVEHEAALRETLSPFLPQVTFTTLPGCGHLSPLEAPADVAAACLDLLGRT